MIKFIGKKYPIIKPTTLHNFMKNNRTAFNEKLADLLTKKFDYIECENHPEFITELEIDISDNINNYEIIKCCCEDFRRKIIEEGFVSK